MAYVATLQKPWISGSASLVPTWVDDAVATTTLITGFDGGNASSSLSTITDAGTLTPTLEIDSRDGDWRHLLFAVEGVEGKTPTFKLNRATMTSPSFTPTADFLPLWTQDFVTWTQATSRTLTGGTTGTIDFSFDAALPAGRVYVSTHPMGQNADAATFAAELLADYSSVASPTTSADSSGVYNTTPAETGDDGRAVGGNAQYAIKLAFGGSTTDGGPKRKLVMFAGIHAAGEHVSWVSFVAAVRHLLDAPTAANFRANWDVYLYFNVTANGIVGGERRQNPSRNIDPNRDFVDQDLQEIDALTTAILADTGGSATAQFGWHSFSTETDDFIPGTGESPNTETAAFIAKGNTIFSSPRTYYLDIPTAGYRWGYDVLGAKIAFAAELPMRGDTSVAFYEGIGENWIKTLQAVDADGVFYSSTTITASGAVSESATIAAAGALTASQNVAFTGVESLSGAPAQSGMLAANQQVATVGTESVSAVATESGTLVAGASVPVALSGSAAESLTEAQAGELVEARRFALSGAESISDSTSQPGVLIAGAEVPAILSGSAALSGSESVAGVAIAGAQAVGAESASGALSQPGLLTVDESISVQLLGVQSRADTPAASGSAVSGALVGGVQSLSDTPSVPGVTQIGASIPAALVGAVSRCGTLADAGVPMVAAMALGANSQSMTNATPGSPKMGWVSLGTAALANTLADTGVVFLGVLLAEPIKNMAVVDVSAIYVAKDISKRYGVGVEQ